MPNLNVNPMAQPQIRGDLARWNAGSGCFYAEVAPTQLGVKPNNLIAENGSLVTFDNGHMLDELVVFKPKFLKAAVPMGCGTPQIPSGQEALPWQVATELQLLFDGSLGLRLTTITSQIALNSLAALWLQLSFKAEIQGGLITVCRIREPQGVTTGYGTYYGPLLEPLDFIERDEKIFGPRITPPPPPTLPSTAERPKLTSPGDAGAAAKPEPKPSVEPAVTTPDAFARFRPATGPKPY